MRLFAGVELEPQVRARMKDAANVLRQRLDSHGERADLRWVPPENLHITLWFIGHVEEDRARDIRGALERPFETAAFDLRVSGCGAFPGSGSPRVLWVGTHSAGAMTKLYGEVRDRLVPLGFQEERRPYAAHVTIARMRELGRGGRALRAAIEATPADCGVSRVDAVTLFCSRLSPRGATYEPLLRVPLS